MAKDGCNPAAGFRADRDRTWGPKCGEARPAFAHPLEVSVLAEVTLVSVNPTLVPKVEAMDLTLRRAPLSGVSLVRTRSELIPEVPTLRLWQQDHPDHES